MKRVLGILLFFGIVFGQTYYEGDIELPRLKEYFLNIGQAKVATSAYEAFELGYLQTGKDNITIKLPKEGAEQALIKVQNIFNNIELKDNNVIDLRIPNQVILINE